MTSHSKYSIWDNELRQLFLEYGNKTLDYEGEVAIVLGKAGRRITQADAYDHISAITLCNEGTIRDWVRHAKFNVTQGKNWDNSGSIGPWLVPFKDAKQLDEARIITRVNGEVRQDDVLSRMMHPIRREIEYISTFMTLQPGDIIVTGTPTGSGARLDPPQYLKPGDVVEVRERARNIPSLLDAMVSAERDIPEYMSVDESAFKGVFNNVPAIEDVPYPVQMEPNLVIEYYSR